MAFREVDNRVFQGTLAERPAAGIPGRRYIAEDVKALFEDTGTEWVQVVSYGSSESDPVGTNDFIFMGA